MTRFLTICSLIAVFSVGFLQFGQSESKIHFNVEVIVASSMVIYDYAQELKVSAEEQFGFQPDEFKQERWKVEIRPDIEAIGKGAVEAEISIRRVGFTCVEGAGNCVPFVWTNSTVVRLDPYIISTFGGGKEIIRRMGVLLQLAPPTRPLQSPRPARKLIASHQRDGPWGGSFSPFSELIYFKWAGKRI